MRTGCMNRVHLFFWRLWIVLSGIWVLLLTLLGSWEEMRTDRGDLLIAWPFYWALIIGPPLLLLMVGLLSAWVIDAFNDKPERNG